MELPAKTKFPRPTDFSIKIKLYERHTLDGDYISVWLIYRYVINAECFERHACAQNRKHFQNFWVGG